tara:strand:- start:499 stop:1014 length:516 start_codon:yes stop_codon:yes gene_type:complete
MANIGRNVEERLNKKIEENFDTIKTNIINDLKSLEGLIDVSIIENILKKYKINDITSDDLKKRKRIKNVVPYFDRCVGKKASGEQCTRRKKDNYDLCGTHIKGTPHGKISDNIENIRKITVFAKEIKGIVYYIDNSFNVYDTEDVYQNKQNPRIIAKYSISENNDYSLVDV